ncbi:MAG TPA: TIGR03435 family protein [Terriglobales bacterium]|nr:TIGR03435 family protein [Terriglobales bacterium]
MAHRRLTFVISAIFLFGSFACARATRQKTRLAPLQPQIVAAKVVWSCGRMIRGGGCSQRAEQMQIDPLRFSCPDCPFWMLASIAFGDMHPAEFKPPNPLLAFPDLYQVEVVFSAPASHEQMQHMLLRVLEQAFGFEWHKVEMPSKVYRLVVFKGGPKFSPGAPPPFSIADAEAGIQRFASVAELIHILNSDFYAGVHGMNHPVVDNTGLQGQFNIALDRGTALGAERPDLVLVKEQLGLEPILARGMAEYIAIDRLNRLTGKWTLP